MQLLTFEHWCPYFWDAKLDRFNGVKFENMVAQLLELEYPALYPGEEWHRTELSWDGKRDFYQRVLSSGRDWMRWVECKAYQKSISFNVLAPTLIMSTLRDINEVIFFSYSQLNREAVSALQEFAQVHQKRVRIFDDGKLEQLILSHQSAPNFAFHTFFPKMDTVPVLSQTQFPIACAIDAFVCSHNTKYSMPALKKQRLRVNELFELRISLINQTLSDQDIVLELDLERDKIYRCLDSEKRELHPRVQTVLGKGEATVITFPFKITGYAAQTRLPYVSLRCRGKNISCETGFFKGSWLLETPYLGDVERLDQYSQTTMAPYETLISVFGPSGAGKTRYLRELQSRRLLAGMKCLWSDAVHTDGNAIVWLKYILSRLYALPLIQIDQYSKQNFPDGKERIVADILYNSEFSLTSDSMEQISAVLHEALSRQNVLLLVDNVQDFDSNSIQIINNLVNFMPDSHQFHLVLSFNTDLLYKQESASSFFRRLQRLSREDNTHYSLCEIKGLGCRYAELFVRSCFLRENAVAEDDQNWRPIIQKIVELAGKNPLYLEQILLYLCEHDILRADEDHLYVFDNHSLPQCLSQIPPTTQELLGQRWVLLKKSRPAPYGALERVLRFMCFFGELQPQLIRELDLEEDAIDCLIDAGFLRREIGITFYHPLIERFFWGKYGGINKGESKQCFRALQAAGMERVYPGQFYICLLRCSARLKPAYLDDAIDILLSGQVPMRLIQSYGDLVFSLPRQPGGSFAANPEKLLRFYIAYGEQQKLYRPIAEVLGIYKTIYQQCLSAYPQFRQFGALYIHVAKEYLNAMLTERHNSESVMLGEQLLADLDTLTFENDVQRTQAEAVLLNRLHVALNRLEEPSPETLAPPHSYALLCRALELSYRIQDPGGIIQNEIDLGNVYYLYGGAPESAAHHWMEAAQIWEDHSRETAIWEGGVYYHQALAYTLLHNWPQAERAVQAVIRFHERTLHNPFFYAKALTLRALLLLIQNRSFSTVLSAVNEAEDICTASGIPASLCACSHIRALAYEQMAKAPGQAALYYEKALTQYIGCYEHENEEKRCLPILLTVAHALRKLRGPFRCAAVNRLKSREAAQALYHVLNAKEDVWQEICRNPPPKGPIYIEDTGINYPCV